MERRLSLRLHQKEAKKAKKSRRHRPREAPIVQVFEKNLLLLFSQNGLIFHPGVRSVLHKIVNQIDPRSFVRLARTCKEMKNFCLDNKEIKLEVDEFPAKSYSVSFFCMTNSIRFELCEESWAARRNAEKTFNDVSHLINDRETLMISSQMPFTHTFKSLNIHGELNRAHLAAFRNYLLNFPELVISTIEFEDDGFVGNYQEFVKFIQEYHIVRLHRLPFIQGFVPPPNDGLSFLAKNKFVISKMTFWHIGRHRAQYFLDPFIGAVSDMLKTVKVEYMDTDSMEADAIYSSPSEPRKFHLLKSDGSLASFQVTPTYVNSKNKCVKMAKRRSARLLEKEEKTKKSNLSTAEPIFQDSPVFDPKNRSDLSQIINNLDPRSFVRLARTCKEMNNFCFNNEDIKVRCWTRRMKEYRCLQMHDYRGRFSYSLTLKKKKGGEFLYDGSFLKKLSSMPFVYTLRRLVIHSTVTDRFLTTLRKWLTRNFPWVRIREIEMAGLENCWDEMAQFVQEAEVVKLSSWLRTTEASRDVLSYLTKNLTQFLYDYRVDGDIIIEAKAKQLHLYGAKITKATFKELVKKFIAGEIVDWIIGREEPFDDERDPFIEAVSEVVKTVTVMDISRRTMERSVLYRIDGYGIFYFRRPDGEMTSFAVQTEVIEFEGI